MERVKDQYSGAGALRLWELSGSLENLPHIICMTDSKHILNISCTLFQVNASAIDYSRKCHPSEIGCKNKISHSEENKKGTSQGVSHNKFTENAFAAAMSMPEA